MAVPSPGAVDAERHPALGAFRRDVINLNEVVEYPCRLFGPDEIPFNMLSAVFEATDRPP